MPLWKGGHLLFAPVGIEADLHNVGANLRPYPASG
jgi:hypothetical protein